MIPVPVFIAVIVLAAAALVTLLAVEQRRIGEAQGYAKGLEVRVAVDEALLEQLRGRRRTADQVRGVDL